MKYLIYILFIIPIHSLFASDIDKAIELYNEGNYIQAEEELLSLPQTAKVLNALGRVKHIQGEYKLAINYYKKGLEIANDTMEAVIRLNLGISFYDIGFMDYAKEEYEKALTTSKKINKMNVMLSSLENLGCYYQLINNNHMAFKYFEKVLNMTNDATRISHIYNNIALIYENNNDFNRAMHFYFMALNYKRKLEHTNELALCYSNIGICYLKQDSLDKARLYLDSASYVNCSSHQYELLSGYLDKLKIIEYENKIRFHYAIAYSVALTLIVIVISVFLYLKIRKIKWNRNQMLLIKEQLKKL